MQLGILELGPRQGPIANQTVLLESERVQGVSTLIRAARDHVPQVRDSQRRAEKNHGDQETFYGPWNCQRRGGGFRSDEEIRSLFGGLDGWSDALAGFAAGPPALASLSGRHDENLRWSIGRFEVVLY